MADALPGAAAPSSLADLATNPTFHPPGYVPDPLALLRLLDGWMARAGYGEDHGWRRAIAASVGAAPAGKPVELPAPIDGLLCGIAHRMSTVLDLLDDDGRHVPIEPVRSMAAHAGYLADIGLQLCRTGPVKGGAAHWLMDDLDRAGLAALGVKA